MKRYWWLTVNPRIFRFKDFDNGDLFEYSSKNEDGSASFHKNERFISLLSTDEQIAFYNQLVEKGFRPDSYDAFSR